MQFITISVDNEAAYSDWKYSLAKYDLMESVSLVTYDDKNIEKNYHFTGVPRYMIIDPQGLIVTTSAPSPSSASMERLIIKLLKEHDAKDKTVVAEHNKAKIKSNLEQTINSYIIEGDPRMFNSENMIKVTGRIMKDYAIMGFDKDVKYYYIEAMNHVAKRDVAKSFDLLKENIFKRGLFSTMNIEDMIYFGKVILYPYQNLGLEECKTAMAKIKEIIESVKDDKSTADYIKGFVSKYENKIKYILTDIEIEKQR